MKKELEIQSLSTKGNGLANSDNKLIEVPFAIPGDTVEVELKKTHKKRKLALLEKILKPSSERIPARCVHFGSCGGCKFQFYSYEKQLQLKQQMVEECFKPLISEKTASKPIIASPQPWSYRNKMEYSFSEDRAGNKFLGLIIESSRGKVLNLTECHLTNPWFIEALKIVREWWEASTIKAYHPPSDQGALRTLTVREALSSGDRLVMLTVSGNPEFALHKSQLDALINTLKTKIAPENGVGNLSFFLRIQQIQKGKETEFFEMHLYGQDHLRERLQINVGGQLRTLNLKVSPSAFFQPNHFLVERLYSEALTLANASKEAIVYDLFCGIAGLGSALSPFVKQVIGIELSPEACVDARENAKLNQCENLTIYCSTTEKALQQISEEKFPTPDLVIVDPPRVGLGEKTRQQIVAMRPESVLYISCNPHTQAIDVEYFLSQGYQLVTIQPIDQFPQTFHCENIILLKR